MVTLEQLNSAFQRRSRDALLLSVTCMVLIAGLFSWQVASLNSNESRIGKGQQILLDSKTAADSMDQAESGLHDFLLSGKKASLDSYTKAVAGIDPALLQLGTLISGDAALSTPL